MVAEPRDGKEPGHNNKHTEKSTIKISVRNLKYRQVYQVTKKRSWVLEKCVKVTERVDTWWENMQRYGRITEGL